jgi:hypothetical protein
MTLRSIRIKGLDPKKATIAATETIEGLCRTRLTSDLLPGRRGRGRGRG